MSPDTNGHDHGHGNDYGNDYPSAPPHEPDIHSEETDSEDRPLLNHPVYTPSRGPSSGDDETPESGLRDGYVTGTATGTGDKDEDENIPLLSSNHDQEEEQPPRYEESEQRMPLLGNGKGKGSGQFELGKDVEEGNNHHTTTPLPPPAAGTAGTQGVRHGSFLSKLRARIHRGPCRHCRHGSASGSGKKKCRRIYLVVLLKLALLFVGVFLLLSLVHWPRRLFHWHGNHHNGHHHHHHENDTHRCDSEYDDFTPESSSREIIIDNGARSIWGRYPLFDLLSLSTTSGSIAVTVVPQEADPENPDEPARLRIRSGEGSVRVSFGFGHGHGFAQPSAVEGEEGKHNRKHGCKDHKKKKPMKKHGCSKTHKPVDPEDIDMDNDADSDLDKRMNTIHHLLPPRPYEIDIETTSGSISGRLIFSSSATLTAGSGSISAILIPVTYPDSVSNVSLSTYTHQGSQRIRLKEPLFLPSSSSPSSPSYNKDDNNEGDNKNDNENNTTIPTSTHASQSGSIDIIYPRSWAGKVHAESQGKGRICLDGRGLTVSKSGDGYAEGFKDPRGDGNGEWWGGRGDMNVSLVSGGGGSILFFVGR